MVKDMQKGSVIVDVSSDQGGTCETLDHQTSHAEPIEVIHGVVHYAVPNMPGAVPISAADAIQGVIDIIINNKDNLLASEVIKTGIQIQNGVITNENLKGSFDGKNN